MKKNVQRGSIVNRLLRAKVVDAHPKGPLSDEEYFKRYGHMRREDTVKSKAINKSETTEKRVNSDVDLQQECSDGFITEDFFNRMIADESLKPLTNFLDLMSYKDGKIILNYNNEVIGAGGRDDTTPEELSLHNKQVNELLHKYGFKNLRAEELNHLYDGIGHGSADFKALCRDSLPPDVLQWGITEWSTLFRSMTQAPQFYSTFLYERPDVYSALGILSTFGCRNKRVLMSETKASRLINKTTRANPFEKDADVYKESVKELQKQSEIEVTNLFTSTERQAYGSYLYSINTVKTRISSCGDTLLILPSGDTPFNLDWFGSSDASIFQNEHQTLISGFLKIKYCFTVDGDTDAFNGVGSCICIADYDYDKLNEYRDKLFNNLKAYNSIYNETGSLYNAYVNYYKQGLDNER